jgi:large subunit ribosomal protein L13
MVTRIKPYNPRAKDLVADWHVIDASGEVLGRLASRVAWLLMGKHKPGYVRHLSSGDFVVVINAEKVRTTGKKSEQIVYRRHSQYPGNLKEIPYQRVMDTHPTRIIEHAVRGMLPKSKLGDRMYTRLKVYAEETHPHVAQLTGSQRRIERLAAEATETAEDQVKAAVQEATSPARRRRRPARPAVDVPEPVVADASPTEAATDDAPAVEAPPRPPRRRRRRRTRSAAAAAAVAAGETAAGPATTDAPAAEVEASADTATLDESSMQRPAGSEQAEGNDDTAADDRNKDVPGDA